MSESKSVVLVDNEGGVRTLRMNRPEVLNALSDELLDRLGEEAEAATTKLAQELAGLPTRAMGLTKRALNHGWPAALEDQLAYEAVLQATAARTEDHVEGVEAFLEKRPPQFQGK